MKGNTKLCKAEVNKNIVLVETGGELTLPLAILNKNCEFRKIWKETYDKWHPDNSLRAYNKAYGKAYRKVYYQKPEVIAHRKAYGKAYYQKKKLLLKNKLKSKTSK